jgi:hypothetical protein
MEHHGTPRDTTEHHGTPRNTTGHHGTPRDTTGHRICYPHISHTSPRNTTEHRICYPHISHTSPRRQNIIYYNLSHTSPRRQNIIYYNLSHTLEYTQGGGGLKVKIDWDNTMALHISRSSTGVVDGGHVRRDTSRRSGTWAGGGGDYGGSRNPDHIGSVFTDKPGSDGGQTCCHMRSAGRHPVHPTTLRSLSPTGLLSTN